MAQGQPTFGKEGLLNMRYLFAAVAFAALAWALAYMLNPVRFCEFTYNEQGQIIGQACISGSRAGTLLAR